MKTKDKVTVVIVTVVVDKMKMATIIDTMELWRTVPALQGRWSVVSSR